jgi:DHA1 family tetracycline resistance protein-like MFS transporter
LPSTFVLYASYRYQWDERAVGLTLAAVGVCSGTVQGGLVGPVVARLGERKALLLGLVFGIAGFAGFGLAPSGILFWLAIPLISLWGLSGPTAQGLMTRRVSGSEQGQLQGANGSLRGISGLAGPAIFTLTFASFIGPRASWHLPGAPFLLASFLLVAALLVAWRVTQEMKNQEWRTQNGLR